jgi:cyclic beta-1,2-glucan synthetase
LITAYVEWVLGFSRTTTASHIVTEFDKKSGAIFAYNPWNTEFGRQISFATFSVATEAFTCDRSEFIGRNKNLSEPNALSQDEPLSGKTGAGLDPCAALQTEIEIPPNERVEVLFFLGQTENREVALEIIERYRAQGVNDEFKKVQNEWQLILTKVQVETPDKSMDVMLNRWLLYQTIVCRFWARAAFYQAGGAYGFRDQLQDTMALTLSNPELTRAHILKAAARQFVEGDVQHWWHPPSGRGVRTHFSDDLLWLPFVVSHYLKVSQDVALLDQEVSFIQGPLLAPEQEDSYYTPEISSLSASLYEHCARTLDRSLTVGAHGLPLMGCGDWNDGMNRVGHKGLGESVWLAWFLYLNLVQFSKIAQARGDITRAEVWLKHSEKLKEAVEDTAWDGAWYKRAFFDDGTPLGSASSIECRIDSIAQTWGILSGAADKARAKRAMESVEEFLIKPADDLLLLFAPPFDKTPLDPGYIKGYLPGVRENGGQYSHAAVWCIFAYANLDNGARATELFSMLNPITHGSTRAGVHRYKVEPYVIAADVYSEPPYVGRGGWTWYTGSSGWMYRAGVEAILGFNISGDYLELTPHILPEWPQYKITYRHDRTKSTHYEIKVLNPENATSIIASVEVDGKKLNLPSQKIQLVDDGGKHSIVFTLGLFVSDSVT